ncbi:MAG: dihydrodipicolinate synthase family protein [Verrucomicrobiae bacterium]|nr:dihydrodipicolinate synthase family protein [Verrucomicrobiae bacterium]MCP5541052.1 dihydrodipicolinate synthase family protein [Akkermansiaceae bacterium]
MELDELRARLLKGGVIPACPLALNEDGSWSERHQGALMAYYREAGALGVAVGVHTTQFEIREPRHGLFEPVLELCANRVGSGTQPCLLRIAGLCGETAQALGEAETARRLGYDAGLLSVAALKTWTEPEIVAHCRAVSEALPVFGFYLQPAVGGRDLSYDFWRAFAEIENVVAIKIAAFNRYRTLEVIRALTDAGRDDIALYTGNDDHIIGDLLTAHRFGEDERAPARRFAGGLLGQWAVWTRRAVEMHAEILRIREGESVPAEWLTRNAQLTDANAALFDAANGFAGCIPGINEVLRRRGLLPSRRCLNPAEEMSPGQAERIDRVSAAYSWLVDDAFVLENRERWLSES